MISSRNCYLINFIIKELGVCGEFEEKEQLITLEAGEQDFIEDFSKYPNEARVSSFFF